MNKFKLISFLLLFVLACQNDAFAQGTFNERKYTKSKVRIWVEDHLGAGKRKTKAQEDLKKAMAELEKTKKIIEEKKSEVGTITPPENSKINEVNNWENDLLEEINKITNEINNLITEASELNPFKPKDKTRLTEIEIALTNLINKKIIPFKRIEMQIENAKVLASDYSFETGKAILSKYAVNEIKTFNDEWEKEIQLWLNYTDTDGNKIYKNDKIQVRINIIGYADMQGRGNIEDRKASNKNLSIKRADNVNKEIKSSIVALENKYNIDVEFITVGKGEEMPPNTKDTELVNNPERRKVVVTTAIYPKKLIENK
jgi:outer membrane protein OmpA-like peptidoglycan-associated protein